MRFAFQRVVRRKAKLLAVEQEGVGAGGEQDGGEDLCDGKVVLAVAVTAEAARERGAVAGDEGQGGGGLKNVLGSVDGGTNGGGGELGRVAGAEIERELGFGGGVER